MGTDDSSKANPNPTTPTPTTMRRPNRPTFLSSLSFVQKYSLLTIILLIAFLFFVWTRNVNHHPKLWFNKISESFITSKKATLPVTNVNGACIRRRGHIEVMGVKMPYVEVGEKHYGHNTAIILLHGARYSSDTWENLGTLDVLSGPKCKRRVIALNVPGGVTPLLIPDYNTKNKQHDGVANDDYASFQNEDEQQQPSPLIELTWDAQQQVNTGNFFTNCSFELFGHHLVRPIVIAPSMSGQYVLPVVAYKPHYLKGFIGVAPYGYDAIPVHRFGASSQLPTLLMYGDRDEPLQSNGIKKLSRISGSKIQIVKNADHALYLDQPQVFHESVLQFVLKIDEE
jgi:abhydrolase domain-containing protein 14